jgi:hypothetical protein
LKKKKKVLKMDKVYTDLQYAENEFFRAYNLALNMAGSVEGTIARVEKIREDPDLEESVLYQELQDGIKAVGERALKNLPHAEFEGRPEDKTETAIEYLRKQYAAKKTKVLEDATVKLRAIALGR